MKKLLLICILLFGLPSFAYVTLDGEQGVQKFREDTIAQVITVDRPTYGVKVIFKNGQSKFIMGSSRSDGGRLLTDAYLDLQKYYGWSDDFTYTIMKRQDKARLMMWEP